MPESRTRLPVDAIAANGARPIAMRNVSQKIKYKGCFGG